MLIDIQSILELDRNLLLWINGSDSIFFDRWMCLLTSGLTWIPLYIALLYMVVKNNETMSQILLIIGCSCLCVLLADGVADYIVKPLVGRWRPSNDPILKYTVRVVDDMRGSDYGFFSAHAANTFSIALFFCLLVRSKLLSVSLILWSFVNCYTRMYLGLHYPIDILCGILWGGIVGCLSYYIYTKIYKRIAPANNFISTQYTSTGYSTNDVDIVLLVLVATFTYTVIRSIIVYY